MSLKCDCEDYEGSMAQIIRAQLLEHVHGGQYTGKVFIYCPWCGKLLIEEKKNEIQNS